MVEGSDDSVAASGHWRPRTRWVIAGILLGVLVILFWLCVGLVIGFIIGNLVGQNAVCNEVYEHVENPQDVPTCANPWW